MKTIRIADLHCDRCEKETRHIKQKCQECGTMWAPGLSYHDALTRNRKAAFGRGWGHRLINARHKAHIAIKKAQHDSPRSAYSDVRPRNEAPANRGRGRPGIK